ncbi:SRPBCC domain-containing protein [Microbacterium sp. ET2]|nr:SRPBCC domain-containing protein [Microbacterium sp. ET2 (Ac-2212)]WJL97299.1 SRPBCC domain-containing protein [Microbacterium sp. ET2 (Ac-2212)]
MERVIRAPRSAVWNAWTVAASLERWWLPVPARCRVVELDPRPGGGLRTEMSVDEGPFVPHITGCFLDVDPLETLVFTTTLAAGSRPVKASCRERSEMTLGVTLRGRFRAFRADFVVTHPGRPNPATGSTRCQVPSGCPKWCGDLRDWGAGGLFAMPRAVRLGWW